LLIVLCSITIFAFQVYASNGDVRNVIFGPNDAYRVSSTWIKDTTNQIYLYCAVGPESASDIYVKAQCNWEGLVKTDYSRLVSIGKSYEKTYTPAEKYQFLDFRIQLEAETIIWPYGNRAIGKLVD
jgi:hypothetical protein